LLPDAIAYHLNPMSFPKAYRRIEKVGESRHTSTSSGRANCRENKTRWSGLSLERHTE